MAKVCYTSENQVFAALKKRFSSPEYVTFPSVRDAAGFESSRTIDAMIMGLWPSRGLLLHGVEIKTSRSDWLRELRDPKKQESIFNRCDRFWLAVGNADIVKNGELPGTWGLLVPNNGGSLKIKKQAPELKPSAPLDRSFLAAILRRADESLRDPEMEDRVRHQLRFEYDALIKIEIKKIEASYAKTTKVLEDKLRAVKRFEDMAEIKFSAYQLHEDVAKLIKLHSKCGLVTLVTSLEKQLTHIHRQTKLISESAMSTLDTLSELQKEDPGVAEQ